MPESDDEAQARRTQSILTQALREAEIRGSKEMDTFPALLGGTKVYWKEIGDNIELRLDSASWSAGRLRTSITLKALAFEAAKYFPDDTEAVKALVAALRYIQATISELLPRLQHDLLVRASNVRVKQIRLSEDEKQVLKRVEELIIIPMESSFEARRKELKTSLRAERRRGGSEPEIEVSDEQCAGLSTEYPVLLKHWRNIKKWHREMENWRDHARLDFPDTPDDLLDKLSDPDPYERQPSVLAHEHAARRCGIPADTYRHRSLSRLRQRGDKLLGQSKTTNE